MAYLAVAVVAFAFGILIMCIVVSGDRD